MSVSVERRRDLVNGEFVEGTRGEWERVLNPATGEVNAEVPKGSEEDVDGAVEAAHEACTRSTTTQQSSTSWRS